MLFDMGSDSVDEADLLESVKQISTKRRSMEFQFDPQVEQGLSLVAQAWLEHNRVEAP